MIGATSMAQGLTGPQSYEVDSLCSRFVRACKRGDTGEARHAAIQILGIYRQAGVDIAALANYRKWLEDNR